MQQNAFDATQAHVFTFNVYSGSQITGSKLTIKNNATLETVYDGTETSYAFEHTVPANTLTNGVYYQASIQTMDAQGNFSPASNIIQFYCYSAPTLVFNNIPTANIIPSASFAFEVKYNQAEGEALDSYVFNLYTTAGTLISTSGRLYNTTTTVPTVFAYTFSGFNNGENYVVEVNAVTVEGTQITTGKQTVFVQYSQPGMFSSLYLTNNCKNGYITVQANVIGINGEADPMPPNYKTLLGENVVELQGNQYVQWTEGYEIPENFTLRIWGSFGDETLVPQTEFSTIFAPCAYLTNAKGNFIEVGVKCDVERNSAGQPTGLKASPCLTVKQDITDIHGYELVGEKIAYTEGLYVITLKCINNLYSISLSKQTTTGGTT
jgi:hypothetical protein